MKEYGGRVIRRGLHIIRIRNRAAGEGTREIYEERPATLEETGRMPA